MAAEPEPDSRSLPDELVHAIHGAFSSEPPRRSELFAPGADDGDADDIRKKLRGRRWTAVPRTLVVEERSGLSWFSDAARRHYLPLWLLASGSHGLVRLWTVSHLRQVAERPTLAGAVAQTFSRGEVEVVLAFLRWVHAFDDVRALAAAATPWWTQQVPQIPDRE